MAELWRILNISNPTDPRCCSVCFEPYSKNNPVVFYSTCKHVICSQCYGVAGNKSKCQNCGLTNGQYALSNELTQAAEYGSAK